MRIRSLLPIETWRRLQAAKRNARTNNHGRRSARFESLEDRTLLSVTPGLDHGRFPGLFHEKLPDAFDRIADHVGTIFPTHGDFPGMPGRVHERISDILSNAHDRMEAIKDRLAEYRESIHDKLARRLEKMPDVLSQIHDKFHEKQDDFEDHWRWHEPHSDPDQGTDDEGHQPDQETDSQHLREDGEEQVEEAESEILDPAEDVADETAEEAKELSEGTEPKLATISEPLELHLPDSSRSADSEDMNNRYDDLPDEDAIAEIHDKVQAIGSHVSDRMEDVHDKVADKISHLIPHVDHGDGYSPDTAAPDLHELPSPGDLSFLKESVKAVRHAVFDRIGTHNGQESEPDRLHQLHDGIAQHLTEAREKRAEAVKVVMSRWGSPRDQIHDHFVSVFDRRDMPHPKADYLMRWFGD